MKNLIKALFIALALSACADGESVNKNEKSPQNANQNADKALLDSELSDFYEQIISVGLPDAKVKVAKREQIGAYEQITLEISSGGQSQTQTIFARGGFLFPDVIDVRGKRSFLEEVEVREYQRKRSEFTERVRPVLRAESAVIALGDEQKPLMYVFSDPECPYCRMHLAKIEDELKLYRFKFVLTTVHGDSALAKVAAIYSKIKNDMSDAEKIAILREFYAKNARTPKVSASELKKAKNLREKYQNLGLHSVPTMVEDD